jgi:hypothetical protein
MSRRSESRPDFREHNLNDADLQKMTSDALFYVLVADQKKSLIKRPDLLKTCDLAKKPKAVQVELGTSGKLFCFCFAENCC